MLICTGTQGEENATLAKLAAKKVVDRRLPQVKPGNVVVQSARAIPGNDEYIDAVLDGLRAKGAVIITAADLIDGSPVHVTGHPCGTDLRAMYAAARPRSAIPVHGTPKHLEAHAALARELGVEAVTVPVNGAIYELSKSGATKVGRLMIGRVALLNDGAATLVPWSDAEQRPLLSGADAVRIRHHMHAEAERFHRKMDRLAGDQRLNHRSSGNSHPRSSRDERSGDVLHAAEVKRPFMVETPRRQQTSLPARRPQSFIDGPQPF